jgi:hypothetical protein
MNLTQKTSPKGIDVVIDEIQTRLSTAISWTNFNSYPRIYKEEIDGKVMPMLYTGSKEYQDVFTNDGINGSLFFYPEDTRGAINNGYFNDVTLSMIVQLDLGTLYPTITHRADEEAHNDILLELAKISPTIKIISLVTGLKNVYSEFDTTQTQFDDISKFHVFRIDMKTVVQNNCN